MRLHAMISPRNIADTLVIAQAPRGRLGKRLMYASDQPDGVWRDPTAPGRWTKPSEFTDDINDDANVRYKKYIYRVLDGVDTLEKRYMVRSELAQQLSLSLVLGAPGDRIIEDIQEVAIDPATGITQNITGPLGRGPSFFTEEKRSFFTVDLDNLDLGRRGFDAFENDGEMPDIIADILDECGLDWLITDCVIHLSSSHGLVDRTSIKAHLDFHLSEPMTLDEQKIIASYINKLAKQAGVSDALVDTSIYESRRLLFTAPAELYKRTQYGKDIPQIDTVPAPHLWRVRHVSRGQSRLRVPDEALDAVKTARAVKRVTGYTGNRAPILDGTIKPGNVYGPIRARIYQTATDTPAHLAKEAKARLKERLRQELEQLPDHAEKGLRRMRYLSDVEFDRSWNGALERRYQWRIVTTSETHTTAAVPVETARADLVHKLANLIQKGIDYHHERIEDETSFLPEPPTHTLILSPPGIGKTEAVVRGVQDRHILKERLSFLAPSTRLSEEATQRMRESASADEEVQAQIRIHKGREKLCEEPRYNKLAKNVEGIGISPAKSVCGHCPRKDACPWPAQLGDKAPGIIFGQHAHATTTLAKIKDLEGGQTPATGVVDESIIAQVLGQEDKRKLETLAKWAKRASIKSAKGETFWGMMNDLIAYRSDVVKALQESEGIVSLSRVLQLGRKITVRRGETVETMPAIDDALRLEREVRRYWTGAAYEALDEFHAATKAGKSTRTAERSIAKAKAQLIVTDWFTKAFRLIKGSFSVAGRRHVFGMRSLNGWVYIQKRNNLPLVMQERNWTYLDGTADPDVWKVAVRGGEASRVVPQVIKLDVLPGSYTLTQYVDKPYGRRFFMNGGKKGYDNSRIGQMARFVQHQANEHSTVLFIGQQALTKELETIVTQDNVHFEHFGNLRGIDKYKHVPCVIVVGRPMPQTTTLEMMTEALHYDNDDVPELHLQQSVYHEEKIELPMANRQSVVKQVESHPDPNVRAMMRQVADAEVKQAVNRLRLFDRDESNPAHLHVFGQIDTGLVITELRDWKDADYSRGDQQKATGVLSTSRAFCEALGEKTGKGARTIRRHMADKIETVNWPEYKFRVGGRPCKGKINAATAEAAAKLLSLLGLDVSEVA